jgi:hypothetical protein
VCHRTGTVQCPMQIAFLNWRSRPFKIWSRWRTGHCPVPQSDRWLGHASRVDCAADGSPDSPVNFSRTPSTNSRERTVDQTPAWHTGHCPVHHRTLSGAPRLRRVLAAPAKSFSFCIFSDSSTYTNMLVHKNNGLSLESYLCIDLHIIHHLALINT